MFKTTNYQMYKYCSFYNRYMNFNYFKTKWFYNNLINVSKYPKYRQRINLFHAPFYHYYYPLYKNHFFDIYPYPLSVKDDDSDDEGYQIYETEDPKDPKDPKKNEPPFRGTYENDKDTTPITLNVDAEILDKQITHLKQNKATKMFLKWNPGCKLSSHGYLFITKLNIEESIKPFTVETWAKSVAGGGGVINKTSDEVVLTCGKDIINYQFKIIGNNKLTANVIVAKTDKYGKHTVEGIAEHYVVEKDNEFYYVVCGEGKNSFFAGEFNNLLVEYSGMWNVTAGNLEYVLSDKALRKSYHDYFLSIMARFSPVNTIHKYTKNMDLL